MDEQAAASGPSDVPVNGAKPRGFALMTREQRQAVGRKGGAAAHRKGTAHRFTPEEAARAGVKGGVAAHKRGTAHRFTRTTAQAANRRSLQSRYGNQPEPMPTPTPTEGDQDGHGETSVDR